MPVGSNSTALGSDSELLSERARAAVPWLMLCTMPERPLAGSASGGWAGRPGMVPGTAAATQWVALCDPEYQTRVFLRRLRLFKRNSTRPEPEPEATLGGKGPHGRFGHRSLSKLAQR